MRILILMQWFYPEPFLKGLPFAKALRDRGHSVQVLTGFPNYPGGKLYQGYRVRLLQREKIDGIEVLRVPLFPSHDQAAWRRLANYFSFALAAAVIGPLTIKPADVMYVYHPPATVGFAALAIRILRRIPFVYDVQDLWPDTLAVTGMVRSRLALKLVAGFCSMIYACASRVTVLSPGFKQRLVDRGVPPGKIDIVYNWCDEDHVVRVGRNESIAAQLGPEKRFNIIYSGNMGKAQALESVLEAAEILQVRLPAVQFVFVGDGIEKENLKMAASRKSLKNVVFLDQRPISEISGILSLADVLMVHLKDDPLFRITIPSKTQAYMAMGIPILMCVRGDAAKMVQDAGAGIVCDPENAARTASAVETLYNMSPTERQTMGASGLSYYRKELALSAGVGAFESIFRSVHAGGR